MEIIEGDLPRCSYPVGGNIEVAVLYAKNAAKLFYKQISNKAGFTDRRYFVVCRGSSGAILSALFASYLTYLNSKLSVVINHLRKDGENSHSGNGCFSSSFYSGNRIPYIIMIDDFIASGNTLNEIYNQLKSVEGRSVDDCLVINNGERSKINCLEFTPELLLTDKEYNNHDVRFN